MPASHSTHARADAVARIHRLETLLGKARDVARELESTQSAEHLTERIEGLLQSLSAVQRTLTADDAPHRVEDDSLGAVVKQQRVK